MQLAVSFSSGGRLVLEPHNPYLSRPLPYLIGCQQFMEDDHVGLGSPSDSEENDVDKNLVLSSESDSEMDTGQNMPKKRTRVSRSTMSTMWYKDYFRSWCHLLLFLLSVTVKREHIF